MGYRGAWWRRGGEIYGGSKRVVGHVREGGSLTKFAGREVERNRFDEDDMTILGLSEVVIGQ